MTEQPNTTEPRNMDDPVGFKAAWDVWCENTHFNVLAPEIKAAIRCGFVAGWKAKEARHG